MKKKILIVFLLLSLTLSIGCIEKEEQTYVQEPTEEQTEVPTLVPISDRNVAKYDFEWYSSDYIGKYSEAPPGYTYAVVSYKIKNDGYSIIDNSPLYWTFIVNGISYDYCSESYDDSINTMSAKIGPGSVFTNKIAFIIHDGGSKGRLKYTSPWFNDEVTLFLDNSLIKSIEPTPYPTYTPRRPKEVVDLTLDDEGFIKWYDSQKIYYNALFVGYDYIYFEDSKIESNNSLTQIERFCLEDKECILLKTEFKTFLEILHNMNEKQYWSISDDKYSSSKEQQLRKYWKSCISIRKAL